MISVNLGECILIIKYVWVNRLIKWIKLIKLSKFIKVIKY